ncbi:MAG: TIGR03619 family F420-dependent LLM class oxidoreductase [Acidimicrobiales bacterium]
MHIIPAGQVVYGMQLPIQSQSALYAEQWERAAGPDELIAIARAADAAGCFYVATCDHVAVPRRLADTMGTTWYDPIATLGLLAGVTTNARLLSHIAVLPFRHPLLWAKAFATLDHLSKGRVIIGVGTGHVVEEFAQLGVPFERRGRLLDEGIDALNALMSEEFATFSGPTWSFDDAGQRPRPVQQPRPPIWVGGSSPAAIRRAAERGDGWVPQGTPRAKLPEQIADLRAWRDKAGRGDEPIDIGANCEFLYIGTPGWDIGGHTVTGAAEAIAETLRGYPPMGVNHLQIRFRSRGADELCDQLAAFGAEVAPLLA